LLSILINTDFFQGNDELIIDEIITFFLAGMKTIQISTTNLIYYLTKHPEIKKKLLSEILPPLEKVTDNIVDDFTYDTVMEYEYL
jgi:cytochrome P450